MRDFKKFTFWEDTMQVTVDVCNLTRKFPAEERYALGDQLRRASVSIASNIAEGSGRNSDLDFAHFLDVSLGSSYEVEVQLYIAQRLGYLTDEEIKPLLNKVFSVQRQISGFIKKLRGF